MNGQQVDLSSGGMIKVAGGIYFVSVGTMNILFFESIDLLIKADGGTCGLYFINLFFYAMNLNWLQQQRNVNSLSNLCLIPVFVICISIE